MILKVSGEEVLLDDDHGINLSDYWVHIQSKRHNVRYVIATDRKTKKQCRLHRLVLGVPNHKGDIDHKNRNPWDNRRENLRFATRAQNRWNALTKLGPYRNVYKRVNGSYQVSIQKNTNIHFHKDGFWDREEAREFAEWLRPLLFGEFTAVL
jgi:hypothetical protein